MSSKKTGLGQGIQALFQEIEIQETPTHGESVTEIELREIRPNPYQPRRHFNEEALAELAESIRENGVLQPIIVRRSQVKGYEIVAGERRFRASQLIQAEKIPAIVREMDEEMMIKYAILENLQREDLTALEEADAYHLMMERLDLTQEKVADALGKSRSHIANHLRLRTLPDEVKQLLNEERISMGQARTLRGLTDEKAIIKLAKKAAAENLTVRQLEKLVAEMKNRPQVAPKTTKNKKSIFVRHYEEQLMDKFGTDVTIKEQGQSGRIQIEYTSASDLHRILVDVLQLNLDD
ncbi:ParB/RepB/Spo0J family partition protein [Allofustis seminis]|uniref:ParB/RepB/Spo0J family partition protein n=1 Tax=Allofustis seminis TaxID=166939 RepID=UPI0003650D5F|nr:ParB/RepB/Spo0J family partition protein [Allofustis seminis]